MTKVRAESVKGPAKSGIRGDILLKGGHVLSNDAAFGDLPVGDVHIRDGLIVAVGRDIESPGAEIVEARGSVVMPGFVDTHWHMWTSLWKGIANDATDYFRYLKLAPALTPHDHYVAVRYAALEGINAGITTCHNWAHGMLGLADAEAEFQALADTGMRSRVGYPAVIRGEATSRDDFDHLLGWIERNGEERLSLGMILSEMGEHAGQQLALARTLGLRSITNHGLGHLDAKTLGVEFIFTHGTGVTPETIGLLKEHGAKFALCPLTDPLIGTGLPPIHDLLQAGFPLDDIGFSVDTTCQTAADPFAALRTTVNAGRIQQARTSNLLSMAQSSPEWSLGYRDAIVMGTLSGAKVLGLDDEIGSLSIGKKADVILVRLDGPNMLPGTATDPALQLVQSALPSNIEMVIIDGIVRKRAGRLVDDGAHEAVIAAAEAQAAILQRV